MFTNREGQSVPQVTFRMRDDYEWVDATSESIFKDKNVIVFSLPGAFTPTCSSSHVPRYNQLAPAFFANGVDAIVCISVNDAFVMNEWKKAQKAEHITFIPDGNGEFTSEMGMLVDKDDLGFGKRSWRYAMLVKNGVIEKMFIEAEVPGDPYAVSDADTMLDYIAPQITKPLNVSMFSREGCPHCARAKQLLTESGVEYEELILNQDYTDRSLRAVSGAVTFPQVFINGQHVGGADELEAWLGGEEAAEAA